MVELDPYFAGEDTLKKRSYTEFKLDKVDKDNIESIEQGLASNTINSGNCSDSLEYLEDLYSKINMIKRDEFEYEGDNNENVNEYLLHIHSLIAKIKRL